LAQYPVYDCCQTEMKAVTDASSQHNNVGDARRLHLAQDTCLGGD